MNSIITHLNETEAETAEALASLQLLMSEFFAPSTSNQRKREIEGTLETFSNRRDAWRHCLLFLQKSENEYVLMFTLTTLENIINRQWVGLTDSEKVEIRVTLWNHLTEKHVQMVYFIRNKLAALIVAIARYDWPHLYPDFFTNIVELIKRGGRWSVLGLTLAHTASEELGTCREGCVAVPSARRLELQRLMLRGMPQLLHILSDILEQNAEKESGGDPPPSPASGASSAASTTLPDLLSSTPHNKELTMEIVMKCLNTLQHLFSWLPLSSHVPPALVTIVFYWGSAATQTQCSEAALAGLGGVCELLYRRYAPPSSAATALRLHHCALRLLRYLTHHPHNMSRAPHQYLNKLAEFLRLFVSLHFKRLEAEPEFDAIEFLTYLFQYTFQVPACSIFVNCLDIWIQFMDIMKPEDTVKYFEALMALVNGILNKIQFQHNKAQLQYLDNETVDDDGETEWQTFLKSCIECIARVSDLSPLPVFTAVLERWQGVAGVYARAAARAAPALASPPDAERLLAALLDLATLTRALGRLAPSLLNEEKCEKRAECVTAGATLLERAAASLAGAALTRPHHAPHQHKHIAHALLHVHAEMFACMGSCACYAAMCGVSSHVMEGLFSSAVPFLMPHDVPEPPVLSHAAAHLILSLSKNLKFATDPLLLVGDLFSQAQRSLQHLEPKTASVVREALISLALSREACAPEVGVVAGAGRGEAAVRALLAAWAAPLLETSSAAAARQVLPHLSQLLLAFTDAPTQAKKVLAGAVQRQATISLHLLMEAPQPELSEFFLALFTCLLQQLGDFADTAVDVFLEVAKRSDEGEGLERLLTCIRLGVERGAAGGAGGVRLASVLRLLTQHVLPHATSPAAAPDLQRALYQLLASLLLHRWRYFFPNNRDSSEDKEKMDDFRTILTAIGLSLLQPDIDVYRLNIETLEHLNTKWKLYHRAIFRTDFLSSFLSVLLLVLVERRQALLREETLGALYAMAGVDLAGFQRAFLPTFLRELPGLAPAQADQLALATTIDTDLPTFTQNIQSLMNDIYYYRMCNSFLAPDAGGI